jgi:hypothetical protein
MGMTERLFPVESEYIRFITALDQTGNKLYIKNRLHLLRYVYRDINIDLF